MNSLKSIQPTKSLKSIKSFLSKKHLTLKQRNKLLKECLDNIDLTQELIQVRKDEIKCRDQILGENYWRTAVELNKNVFPNIYPKLDLERILIDNAINSRNIYGGKTKKRKRKKRNKKKTNKKIKF